jgi:uncharacterized membrane protein YphA (DoxX/SURF4 family)
MTRERTTSKTLNACLWIAQVLLAVSLIWAGCMKLFQPAGELAEMWPWTADHPRLVLLTGLLDLLAGTGLVLPALLRIRPQLTIYAAYGTLALMLAAGIFHIARGEGSQIGVNAFVAALAIFIAWGRFRKAPIAGR